MTMRVTLSNRLELLLDGLVEVVGKPLSSPLQAEQVVVASREMQRWVSLSLCDQFGVWANGELPYPRAFVDQLLALCPANEAEPPARYTPDAMSWAIAKALPARLAEPAFAEVATFLRQGDEPVEVRKLVQLSERVADCFDQYMAYRPALVDGWQGGQDDDWQALLWRELHGGSQPEHLAERVRRFVAWCEQDEGPLAGLPPRVSLFGLGALPELYLEVIIAAARRLDVHMFVHSPSRPPAEPGTEPHELERSLGELGLGFREQLLDRLRAASERAVDAVELVERFAEPAEPAGALTLLQRRVLVGEVPDAEPAAVDPDDRSITVHACHGPMREIEVLHDQLLALFDEDSTLRPRDVIVMAPDMDRYAPLVAAVFDQRPKGAPTIPFNLTDRASRDQYPVIESLEALLKVMGGRFTASEVVDLLMRSPIREQAGIEIDQLDLVREWVTDAGVRWGVDELHRCDEGQPKLRENTWRFGLDRLLLGYAMEPTADRMFGGVLPYRDIEGEAAAVLGHFAAFCRKLFDAREELLRPRALQSWRLALQGLTAELIGERDERPHEHLLLAATIDGLADGARAVAFDREIDLATLRALLQKRVDARRARGGFMTGGVTFCQLRPFRPLPFRVVCLLGLDDGTFPRESRPLGFDRIGQDPEPWDRTPRRDDRQAFLEAVLSTRARLLCSYVGRDIHRNKKLPPSVALAELLDALGDAHHPPGELPEDEDWARTHWVIRHPLQPFSYRYFDATQEPELFCFEERHCAGAAALARPDKEPQVFLDHAVAAPPPAEEIELRDLIGYLQKPAQHYLRTALEVSLPGDPAPLADREPLTLDHLEEWAAGSRLLGRALEGVDLDELWEAIRAQGALPIGTPGQHEYGELRATVEGLTALAARRRSGDALPPRAVSLGLADVVLTGSLGKLFPGGQVHAQYSKLARRSELGVWVEHLVLNALDGPARTHLVGRAPNGGGPIAVTFDDQVADPRALLEQLVALYRLGRRAPLPFFPINSRQYVEALAEGDAESALRHVQNDWNKSCKRELTDGHIELAFRGKEPLGPDFQAVADEPRSTFASLAEWVYLPLLKHRQEAP